MKNKQISIVLLNILAIIILLSFLFLINPLFVYAEEYSITYDLDGGEISADNPTSYTEEDSFSLNNPQKLGYEFIGWTGTGLDAVTANVLIEENSSGDREYYAHFEVIEYSITYHLDDGINNVSNPQIYTVEDNITFSNPTKENYVFIGWYLEDTYENEIEEIASGSVGDLDIYAKFEQAFEIKYDANGGNFSKDPATTITHITQNIKYGDTISLPVPSRQGYDFIGYTLNGEDFLDEVFLYNEDVTLVAKWDLVVYTITYVLDGGVNDSRNVSTYTIEEPVTFYDAHKAGHTFTGWYSSETSNIKLTAYGRGTSGDKTLYARYSINYYNATFKDYEMTYSIKYGDLYNFDPAVESGQTFVGWAYDGKLYTDAEGNSLSEWKFETNIEFTAIWSLNKYTITYNKDGFDLEEDDCEVQFATDYVFAVPSKVGYVFAGWSYDEQLITNELGESLSAWDIAKDVQVEAVWIPIEISLSENLYIFENDINGTYTINYTVTPEGSSSVSFESSDETVAIVDEDGVVTCVGVGIADITCKALNGGDFARVKILSADLRLNSGTRLVYVDINKDENNRYAILFSSSTTINDVIENLKEYANIDRSCVLRDSYEDFLVYDAYCVDNFDDGDVASLNQVYTISRVEGKVEFTLQNVNYNENIIECEFNQEVQIRDIVSKDTSYNIGSIFANSTIDKTNKVIVYQSEKFFYMPAFDVEVGVTISSIVIESNLDIEVISEKGFYPSTSAKVVKVAKDDALNILSVPSDRDYLISYNIDFESQEKIGNYVIKMAIPEEIKNKDGVYVIFNDGEKNLLTQVKYEKGYVYFACQSSGTYAFVSKTHEVPINLHWLIIVLWVLNALMIFGIIVGIIYSVFLNRKYNNMYSFMPLSLVLSAFIMNQVVGIVVLGVTLIFEIIGFIYLILKIREIKNEYNYILETIKNTEQEKIELNENTDESNLSQENNNID